MLRKKPGSNSLCLKQGDGFDVKAGELFCAKPVAFISNGAVSEIASSTQGYEACFDGWSIYGDVGAGDEMLNRIGDGGTWFLEIAP